MGYGEVLDLNPQPRRPRGPEGHAAVQAVDHQRALGPAPDARRLDDGVQLDQPALALDLAHQRRAQLTLGRGRHRRVAHLAHPVFGRPRGA